MGFTQWPVSLLYMRNYYLYICYPLQRSSSLVVGTLFISLSDIKSFKFTHLILSINFFVLNAVLAIVLVGLLYGFFIAIICGQRINERHYHVLAKQELTKV